MTDFDAKKQIADIARSTLAGIHLPPSQLSPEERQRQFDEALELRTRWYRRQYALYERCGALPTQVRQAWRDGVR